LKQDMVETLHVVSITFYAKINYFKLVLIVG